MAKKRNARRKGPARGKMTRVTMSARGGVGHRGSDKRGGHGGYKGFKSRAQWRMFWANPKLRRYARKKAHETAGGPKVRYRRLPERKGAPGARSAR